MQKWLKTLSVSSFILFINACSTTPYHSGGSFPVEDRSPSAPEVTTLPDSSDRPQASPAPEVSTQAIPNPPTAQTVTPPPTVKQSPAVIALLSNANTQQQQGDYYAAQNTLQRAQRIAPRDPQVYYALAKTHLELETYSLAEQVALKGASLVSGDRTQLKKFWNLIANIRLQAGNPVGAEIAQRRADNY